MSGVSTEAHSSQEFGPPGPPPASACRAQHAPSRPAPRAVAPAERGVRCVWAPGPSKVQGGGSPKNAASSKLAKRCKFSGVVPRRPTLGSKLANRRHFLPFSERRGAGLFHAPAGLFRAAPGSFGSGKN